MGKDHYISLITKKLNSELNAAELKELNTWLSGSSSNANTLSDFKDVWGSVSSYKSSVTFDADVAYESFIKKYNIEPSDNLGKPVGNGSSVIRFIFSILTIAALVIGGKQLMNSINHGVSNDQLVSRLINLDANSTATLAPSTQLDFNKDEFTVSNLNGQVYFDIDRRGNTLNLDFDEITANASGALFNIQNYQEDKKLIADVEKGTVSFNVSDKEIKVGQGKRLIYTDGSDEAQIVSSDPSSFAWEKGELSFDNTPLAEVFSSIEKFYGVNIEVVDDSKLEGHLTAIKFRPDSLNECLQMINSSIKMTIVRKGLKQIEISNIQPE